MIVFATLAVSRRIEQVTGWPVRKFARTGRRNRIIEIRADAAPSPPGAPVLKPVATMATCASSPPRVEVPKSASSVRKQLVRALLQSAGRSMIRHRRTWPPARQGSPDAYRYLADLADDGRIRGSICPVTSVTERRYRGH